MFSVQEVFSGPLGGPHPSWKMLADEKMSAGWTSPWGVGSSLANPPLSKPLAWMPHDIHNFSWPHSRPLATTDERFRSETSGLRPFPMIVLQDHAKRRHGASKLAITCGAGHKRGCTGFQQRAKVGKKSISGPNLIRAAGQKLTFVDGVPGAGKMGRLGHSCWCDRHYWLAGPSIREWGPSGLTRLHERQRGGAKGAPKHQ